MIELIPYEMIISHEAVDIFDYVLNNFPKKSPSFYSRLIFRNEILSGEEGGSVVLLNYAIDKRLFPSNVIYNELCLLIDRNHPNANRFIDLLRKKYNEGLIKFTPKQRQTLDSICDENNLPSIFD
jgi:hypothetical protein